MISDDHRALREQLGAYALGQLDEAEWLRVRTHLEGCAECRAELTAIDPLARRLAMADPERLTSTPTPPPGLADEIVRRIQAERRPSRGRLPRWASVAAAAVIALVLGGVVGYVIAPKPPALPLEPVAVRALHPAVKASAQLVPHTWGTEIKLTARGFDQGARYRVVVIDEEGDRVGAGGFVGTGDDEMRCNLNATVLRPDAAGFRVIDAAGDLVLTSTF